MSAESGKVCDWYLSDGRKLDDLRVDDLQVIVDARHGEPERARQRDAWMAEAILRHIAHWLRAVLLGHCSGSSGPAFIVENGRS